MAKKEKTIEERVREILEEPFWLRTLETGRRYNRVHDDHDGTFKGSINITFGWDGDAWVECDAEEHSPLRFRMEMTGGGRSPRTRKALLILAEAIRLDNEECPQVLPSP